MFKSNEYKAFGSIRKTKVAGACGVILALAMLGIAFGSNNVSADEVKPTTPATTEVAKPTTETITSESTSAPVKVEAVSETGYPSTNLTEKQPEPTAEHVEMTNNANKAGKEIVTPVETPELDKAVEKAKNAGVEATEKPQVAHNTLPEAKADEQAQVKKIESAKAEKVTNTNEIKKAQETNATINAENKAEMEKHGLTFSGDSNKDAKTVADYNSKTLSDNKVKEENYKKAKANAEKVNASNKAIMEAKGLKYTGVWETDKATVEKWNKENAGVRVVTTKETGLTATASTTFEAVSGASKAVAPDYTANVIQGYARNTNLDANFDNVFLLDDKSGVAEIKVKNTSHGDVTLKFNNITPSAESGFIRSYVALWAGEDGGIGYGVFISAGAGEANGGGGVDGQGGGGASGAYRNDRQGWIKQVTVGVVTDANDVSEVTVNDVDSNQVINASTISGAKITTGKNISQSGNTFTANDSAQSQSTSGVLDSNGIGWSLDKGQKINFSFDHINTSDTSYSIVGGVFGRASQKEVKEEVKPISIEKATIPSFSPKSTLALKPLVKVPLEKKIAVDYHKTAVKYAPKISKGVVNDDNKDIDGKQVPKGSLVNWTLNTGLLKAGREAMTAIELNDPLESGYKLDEKATAKANPTFEFTHNGQGRTVIKFGASELAKANANLDKDYVMPQIKLIGTVLNDNGFYNNTYSMTLTTKSKKKYTVTSNTPRVKTPGSKPVKDVLDGKGVSINGKSVLPTTELNYKLTQNLSNYKGVEASKSSIMKNFALIEDPDENSIDTSTLKVKSITAGNKDVSKLLQMHHVLSMNTLDAKLRQMVIDSGISPVGEFYMWVAKEPQSFYEAYVKKGMDITYNLSFKIKQTFTQGDIINAVHQIDFGNGYAGNKVVNHLPKPEVHKDVLNVKGDSIDGKRVQLGDLLTYKLEGWVIPANRGYDLWEYRFVDSLDVEHDEYQGFTIKARKDFVVVDAKGNQKAIKAGDDLKAYTETVYNAKTGLFETRFTKEFLASIPRTSEFGADAFVEVKRIAHGEVNNEYTLFVNGTPVLSNKVKTYSFPDPEPKKPQPQLPNTGEGSSMLGMVGLIMSLSTAGFVVTAKRKEN